MTSPSAGGMTQDNWKCLCALQPAARVQIGGQVPERGQQQRHVSIPILLGRHLLPTNASQHDARTNAARPQMTSYALRDHV